MNKREIVGVLVLFFLINLLFFYKFFFHGLIPFPGELLVSEYKPWQSYSYLGYNPGAIPNKAQYFDTIRQLYPWKTLSINQIKNLVVPLWNPYNFSGSPLLANFQSAIFYILNLFYLILPQYLAWSILIILQPLLAGFFTYLYCQEIGIKKTGSLLASIAFSCSLFMSVFLEYNSIDQTILWLPLILYAGEKIIKKISIVNSLLFIVAIVESFFAGHLQLFSLIIFFLCVYLPYRTNNHRLLIYFVILLSLTAGLSAIQLFPTLELISNSARGAQPYQFLLEKLLIQPKQLLMFISPDIFGNPATRNYLLSDTYPGKAMYIGLIPFLFSVLAISFKSKEKLIKFFSVAVFIIFIFLIRWPFTEVFYKLQLPWISTSSPTNALFLLSFCLAILAGFGIEKFYNNPNKLFKILLIFWGLLLVTFIFGRLINAAIVWKNLLYTTGLLGIISIFLIGYFRFPRLSKQFVGTLLLLTVIDLFYFFQKFNPFVPKELIFPEASIFTWLKENAGIDRFWGYGNASIQANFATQYSLFSPDGYDPLYDKHYGEFIELSKNGKIPKSFDNQNRSDAVVAPGFGETDLSDNPFRLKVLNLLGVKYILDRPENASTEKTFPGDVFAPITTIDNWKIYENKQALPRIFLANNYQIYSSPDEFEKTFFDPKFDPQKTLLLEKKPPLTLDQTSLIGETKFLKYEPNFIAINVNTTSSQLLFISDLFYPGWKASVDEQPTDIYRADYAFRAIGVPAGQHIIEFSYKPTSFSLETNISMISLVSLIILMISLKVKKGYEK